MFRVGIGSSDGGVRSTLLTVRFSTILVSSTWPNLLPVSYENVEIDLLQVLKAKSLCLLKPKSSDFEVTSNDKSDCDHKDEVMEALDKIGAIGEQLNTILDRLNKLDVIEISIKNVNIETNLANLKVRTAKLEDFEAGARKDIEDLKKSCSFNGDNLKEYKENVKKILDEQNQKLNHKIDDLISKNLHLESYSRRENIKFFIVPL